ncbi:uncharacterized protein PG998_004914 [Apiospora kogelbergensis]|uniref:Uncharacterized protein n=1 Tax=Apiospora kogelbergensis TaxID=1337665 RepID=A0AAW0Q9K3_9PEZI
MKMFTQILAFLAFVLCEAAYPPYAAPGDLQCVGTQLVDGPSVKASCPVYQPDKLYLCSLMDLNKCYANQNGNLVAQQE